MTTVFPPLPGAPSGPGAPGGPGGPDGPGTATDGDGGGFIGTGVTTVLSQALSPMAATMAKVNFVYFIAIPFIRLQELQTFV